MENNDEKRICCAEETGTEETGTEETGTEECCRLKVYDIETHMCCYETKTGDEKENSSHVLDKNLFVGASRLT